MATQIWMLAISAAAGLALSLAAPRSWGVAPFHGILLGAAIYVAALRYGTGAFPRAAAFLALAAAQAYVVFVAAPGADLRATFVILSTWIVLESVGGRPSSRAAAR
jgi:hypothetical protein